MPSVRSVALGLWVRTGSRDEQPGQAGVSHFLEHLLFKGTERYSAIEISELFDGLGASTNAATSKESTHLYARLLDEHTDEAFDLLAEMLLGPTYPEVDSERQVVLEEIAMYEDEPQDRVHDVLADAVFGDHPLGRRVIGEAEVIASIPIPKIAEYHAARYVGPNIVVAAAGHVDHERIVELARKHVQPAHASATAPARTAASPSARRSSASTRRRPSSTTSASARPGSARGDDRRFALGRRQRGARRLHLVAPVPRGSREARPRLRGRLVLGRVHRQRPGRDLRRHPRGQRRRGLDVIGSELASIASDGVTEEELVRAKEHIKGRMVLGLESSSRADVADRARDHVRRPAPLPGRDARQGRRGGHRDGRQDRRASSTRPSASPRPASGSDEALFRKALEPVSPALAA